VTTASDRQLLDALLDSWDRNNTILINLLRAVPEQHLAVTAAAGGPSVAALFAHIHYVRLVFLEEDADEFARPLPAQEWAAGGDADHLAAALLDSARAVRDAVQHKVETGAAMTLHYDHPILLLQQMVWHEGYHHGQIKLALKLAGVPLDDKTIGALTWRVWMDKTSTPR
jgi:uncharacterized damage-inducible protein DinB